jgi:hypothetical protein
VPGSAAIGLFAGWDVVPVEALVTCMGRSPVESCRCDCHRRISHGIARFEAMPRQARVPFDVRDFLYGALPLAAGVAWRGLGFFLQINIYYILCSSA